MDLTVFRMFSAGIIMFLVSLMKGQWKAGVRAVKKALLFLELVFYGIVGLMLMHYTYFASIAAGNAAAATVIQYTCPAMVILWVSLKNRKIPARGELLAVVLAIAGVFLLVTGGDIHRISVPAACVYLALASALFFAVCAVYPKHLMTVMDNSFILAIGMFTGAISAWLIDPVTDYSGFFSVRCSLILSGSLSAAPWWLLPAIMRASITSVKPRPPSLLRWSRQYLSLPPFSSLTSALTLSRPWASCSSSLPLPHRVLWENREADRRSEV